MELLLEEIVHICDDGENTDRLPNLSTPFKNLVKMTMEPLTVFELVKFVEVSSMGLAMLLSGLEAGR